MDVKIELGIELCVCGVFEDFVVIVNTVYVFGYH